MTLYRNSSPVGGLTLLSRVAGFSRCASPPCSAPAWLPMPSTPPSATQPVPSPVCRRRLNTAFVPLFSGALAQHGDDHARDLAARIMAWLIAVLVVVTILAEIFMEWVLVPFVPGFLDDPEKFELTVLLTRILFPYLACMSLVAAYAAILNALHRFFAAAFAPVMLNVVTIAVLVLAILLAVEDKIDAALWVAAATIVAGFAQLAIVWWAVRRAGFLPRLQWPRLDPEVRRFWFLALPAVLTGGITQINIFIGTIIASGAASAISYLYYADRLYQLPLGIIGIAIGTVLLPVLSGHLKNGRDGEARDTQEQSLLVAMLLSMPAATALIALAVPIVRVLFERGAFDAVATTETAAALTAFAAGLPAFVLIRVLQPGFFAREDTITPTIFAAISVAVNVGLSLLLFPTLQHVAIALATSVAAWGNALMLGLFLARRGHYRPSRQEALRHAMILLVSLGMALLLYGLTLPLGDLFAPEGSFALQALALAALCAIGLFAYFAAIHVTRVQPMGMLLKRLRGGG